MKVITGTLKGREIRFRPVPGVRPTADKIRKAMVDTLRPKLSEARVLDLFAGSGAIGFEALSNGAASVFFVEADRARSRAISDTAAAMGQESACVVEQEDAYKVIERLSAEGFVYDLIFADPPYRSGDAARITAHPAVSKLLAPDGILIVECAYEEKVPAPDDSGGLLRVLRTREYGGSKVVYLAHRD